MTEDVLMVQPLTFIIYDYYNNPFLPEYKNLFV
jgi:hypothetical protein